MLTGNKVLMNVKYFSLKFDKEIQWEIVRLLLLTLTNVCKLKLEISLSDLPTGEVVVMDSVKYLYLGFGYMLRGIEVPNATGLVIDVLDLNDFCILGPYISYLQISQGLSATPEVDSDIITSRLLSLNHFFCAEWHGVMITFGHFKW